MGTGFQGVLENIGSSLRLRAFGMIVSSSKLARSTVQDAEIAESVFHCGQKRPVRLNFLFNFKNLYNSRS